MLQYIIIFMKSLRKYTWTMIQKLRSFVQCQWKFIKNKITISIKGLSEASSTVISDISVLYKSDHFIVIDKHHDVKINSNDKNELVTVETQLAHLYPHLVDAKAVHSFRFIHRLDYATSGALVVALTKKGAQWGNKAFRKRYVTKHYLALVRGHVCVSRHNICINEAIGKDRSITDVHRMCVESDPNCENPRSAETLLVLLEHGSYDESPASKVLLIPHTGRTHQLRVHCAHLGHLVVGDYTYSNRQDVKPYRMMLHAYRIVMPMKYEHIDVIVADPFTPERDPKWQCSKVFTTYESYAKPLNLESLDYRKKNVSKKFKDKVTS